MSQENALYEENEDMRAEMAQLRARLTEATVALEEIRALGHDIHGDLSSEGCAACIAGDLLGTLARVSGGARGDTTPDVGASVPAPRRETPE